MTTFDSVLVSVDAIASDLIDRAQDRAERIRFAAARYVEGSQLRAEAADLDARGAMEQDAAIAQMSTELGTAKVSEMLGIPTRMIADVIRRYRTAQPQGSEHGSPTGLFDEPAFSGLDVSGGRPMHDPTGGRR